MISIVLNGKVAVKPGANKALGKLVATLQQDSDDVVKIENDVLTIHIGNCEAPNGFHDIACKAVGDFCQQYATAGRCSISTAPRCWSDQTRRRKRTGTLRTCSPAFRP